MFRRFENLVDPYVDYEETAALANAYPIVPVRRVRR